MNTYTIKNTYGITHDSKKYRVVERALKDADNMSGDGWIVVDQHGYIYIWDSEKTGGLKIRQDGSFAI